MIRLVDQQGRPAPGASAYEAKRWADIPEALRTFYPTGDATPERGQSDLYHWEGDEDSVLTTYRVRVYFEIEAEHCDEAERAVAQTLQSMQNAHPDWFIGDPEAEEMEP